MKDLYTWLSNEVTEQLEENKVPFNSKEKTDLHMAISTINKLKTVLSEGDIDIMHLVKFLSEQKAIIANNPNISADDYLYPLYETAMHYAMNEDSDLEKTEASILIDRFREESDLKNFLF